MKRILITGGTGFIGSHLVEYFLKNTDYDVVVLDRLDFTSTLDRLSHLKELGTDRLSFIHHDLKSPLDNTYLLQQLNKYKSFQYIFHLAASSHVDRSILTPLPFVMDNIVGTVNLLDWYKKWSSTSRFFYFSTDEIFGPAKEGQNFKEWDNYNSTNPYAATKAGAEEMCLAYANTYGLDIIITHCMNVFGERQYYEKFIPLCIKNVLQVKEIKIHSSSNGKSGTRFYLHAQNAAKAVHFLCDKAKTREKYNIVGDEEISNWDLAEYIGNEIIANPEIVNSLLKKIDFHSSRPGHDLKYALDGKLMKNMGFSYESNVWDDLKKTVQWFLNNPEWLNL